MPLSEDVPHLVKIVFLLILSSLLLPAAELRVATMNVFLGIEAPGTVSHDALAAVLGRIDADVVALQEVRTNDRSGNPSNLNRLASSLGYSHLFVPGGPAFDTGSGVILMSKFPFLSTHSIISPSGAKDLTRIHAAAVVDVPGTASDPTIITLHLKCCFMPDDPFRRAVEMERVKIFLDNEGLDGSDNIIVLGDYNLLGSPITFNSLPSGLPSTYSLGSDISFPVQYYMNPVSYFTSYPLLNPLPLQQNGLKDATFRGGSVLDYILISQALANRAPVLEVFNSELEARFPGLPKSGSPLASGVSQDASDHFLVFGDFDLESADPLVLTLSTNLIAEGSAGTTLTVTLPQAPAAGEAVTVLLCSSDTSEVMPTDMTLTFPAGVTTRSTTLLSKPDSIMDGSQSVTITASAVGFEGDVDTLTVTDADTATYEITAFGTAVLETFDGFEGTTHPSEWTISDSSWIGTDDGSSSADGLRSYGNEGSLGVKDGKLITFSGTFHNATIAKISSLEISYDAEQWYSSIEGSIDRWEVQVITAAGTISIPALTFTANNKLISGSITNGATTTLSSTIQGVAIAANETFEIQFSAIPGTPGTGGSDTIFLNELHYDNVSSDAGEFIEVIVGPNFPGAIADVEIILYNGNNSLTYGAHGLDTFTLDKTTASGHRIFSKAISGIQNGGPDGIAIVHNASVLQFLSYEGTMLAMNGPANGITSTDIGVSQSRAQEAGQGSLGLTGKGSGPDDFTWTKFSSPFTKGVLNEGQSFGISVQRQGIAIDNLAVTALLPPLDIPLSISPDLILSFPTINGTTYEIQRSTDLENWTFFTLINGNNSPAIIDVTSLVQKRFFRVGVASP